jgi:hypothetical protein
MWTLCVKRPLYLKRQKRVNTFLRSNCPRVYRMNAKMASFFYFFADFPCERELSA